VRIAILDQYVLGAEANGLVVFAQVDAVGKWSADIGLACVRRRCAGGEHEGDKDVVADLHRDGLWRASARIEPLPTVGIRLQGGICMKSR
jgi:hypothetical protein